MSYEAKGFSGEGSNSRPAKLPALKKTYSSPGKLPEMAFVDKHALHVDTDTYQRERVSKAKIAKMVREFSWEAFGALLVARRPDGTLYVYEGGHRRDVALLRPDVTVVPCLIYDIDSIAKEARTFNTVNINRSAVSAFDRWKARKIAGDRNALRVQEILDRHGITATKNPARGTRQLNAIGALVWLVECWPDYADEVFAALVHIHKPEDEPIQDHLLRGMCYLQRNGVDVCNPRGAALKKLTNEGVGMIKKSIRTAKADSDQSGEKTFARGILNVINKGKQRKTPMPNVDTE